MILAGIGTEVGKTVASAVVCEALNADYWKPVQAGDLNNSDSHKVEKLTSNTFIYPEKYLLNHPMSPHAAAERDKVKINPENLMIPQTENHLVIEMAGGLMVPLTKDYLYIDWVEASKLPVILVSSYYLGSINHTLLSWKLLKLKNIPVIGFIFNGEKNKDSQDIILHYTQSKCLLEMQQEEEINLQIIQKYAEQIRPKLQEISF